MRFNTSIAAAITEKTQSRAKGLYNIIPSEQLAQSNIHIDPNVRLVEFRFPSGLFVQHPNMGAGARPFSYKTIRAPVRVDEEGNIQANYILELLGSLKPGPVHAPDTMLILQRLHKALQAESAKAIKNAGPFRPGERIASALQPAVEAAGLSISQSEGYLSYGTSISTLLPHELFLKSGNQKLMDPSRGDFPAFLKTFSQVVSLNNGLGTNQSRLYGNELLSVLGQRDQDGDRQSFLRTVFKDAHHRQVGEMGWAPPSPGTYFAGVTKPESSEWVEKRGRSLAGPLHDLTLLQPTRLRESQNPERISSMIWKSIRENSFSSTKISLQTGIRKALNKDGNVIGQVTNAINSMQRAQALAAIDALPMAEKTRIMNDEGLFFMFMAHAQIMKMDGSPTGLRQVLEAAIQAQVKGRGEADRILAAFPMGTKKEWATIYTQKDILKLESGQMEALLSFVMAGGDYKKGIHDLRTGKVPGSGFDVGKYKSLAQPKPKRVGPISELTTAEGRSAAEFLRDTGMFDIKKIGRRVDQLPRADLIQVLDPSTGELLPKFGQVLTGGDGHQFYKGKLLTPFVSEQGQHSGWSIFSHELMNDAEFRSAMSITDKATDRGYRLVGELVGQWDYRSLGKGDSISISKIRTLARNLGMEEEEVWAEWRKGPSSFARLVQRFELTEGGRFRRITEAVDRVFTALSAKDIRYRLQDGRVEVNSGTLQFASRALMTDSGWLQGSEEQIAGHTNIIGQGDIASPYRPAAGGRFMETMSIQGLTPYTNTARYQTALHQGMNSEWVEVTNAVLQLDIKKYEDLAVKMAHHWAEKTGSAVAPEAEIRRRVRDAWTSSPANSSIKGLELHGQEFGATSASHVQRLAGLSRRSLSMEELAECAGITKQVSGTRKVESLFGAGDFILKYKDGSEVTVQNLVTLENASRMGVAPEMMRRITDKKSTTTGQNLFQEIMGMPLNEPDPTGESLNKFIDKFDKWIDETSSPAELWFRGVGTNKGNDILLTQGNIQVYDELEGQVYNSTELAESLMRPVGEGHGMYRELFTGSTIQDAVAEGSQQIKEGVSLISKLSGISETSLLKDVKSRDLEYLRTFTQSRDTVHSLVAPDLIEATQALSSIIGHKTKEEQTKIQDMARRNMLQGANEALLQSGALTRMGAGIEQEAVNGAGNLAAEVFGYNSKAQQVLSEIGQNIIKQFLD